MRRSGGKRSAHIIGIERRVEVRVSSPLAVDIFNHPQKWTHVHADFRWTRSSETTQQTSRCLHRTHTEQRHAGLDGGILAARHEVYQRARERNSKRWSGATRNWTPEQVVTLNPERKYVAAEQAAAPGKDALAA